MNKGFFLPWKISGRRNYEKSCAKKIKNTLKKLASTYFNIKTQKFIKGLEY